jgi:hypothetical protein
VPARQRGRRVTAARLRCRLLEASRCLGRDARCVRTATRSGFGDTFCVTVARIQVSTIVVVGSWDRGGIVQGSCRILPRLQTALQVLPIFELLQRPLTQSLPWTMAWTTLFMNIFMNMNIGISSYSHHEYSALNSIQIMNNLAASYSYSHHPIHEEPCSRLC